MFFLAKKWYFGLGDSLMCGLRIKCEQSVKLI